MGGRASILWLKLSRPRKMLRYALLLSGAAALVAPALPKVSTKLHSTDYAKTLYGVGPETSYWDPLGLADLGTDATVDFFRAAEVKHGRIAMMACLGYWHHNLGIQLPGYLSTAEKIKFADLGAVKGAAAWAMIPKNGLLQVFGAIAAVEVYELTHKDGVFVGGDAWFKGFSSNLEFDPLGFGKSDPALVKTYKERELKNGRLAMIGIMGFVASDQIAGSVPMLA